jgi:octaprenyl-diphosphate synthase
MKENLELVREQIKLFVEDCNYKKADELLTFVSSGKMLRSKLLLYIVDNKLEQFDLSRGIRLFAIIEMIHLASLLHDDVIDESDTRRGKPSINALFDNKTAIMFGDIMYSKAFFELNNFSTKISQTISNAVVRLSVGELQDVELSKIFNTSKSDYLEMIYNKTSSLIEASAKVAILFVQNQDETITDEIVSCYELYGKNLGLAFQMIDDILDIVSDEATLGKPALLDFVEGKVTIPYLFLYERLDEDDKFKLKSLYKKELHDEDKIWLKEKFEQTSSIKDSLLEAQTLGQEAIKALKNEKNEKLESIMTQMIQRDF